jgi:hypothetical protein
MLKKIVLQPGIQKEGTQYSAEGAWFDCDKVRFRQGRPEKIGGWERASSNTFLGVARKLHNWSSINKDDYLGIGTNKKTYVELGKVCYDITPKRYPNTVRLMFNSVSSTSAEPALAAGTGTGQAMYTDGQLTVNSYVRINNEYLKVASVGSETSAPFSSTVDRQYLETVGEAHNSGSAVFEIPRLSNPIGVVDGESKALIYHPEHGAYSGDYVNFLEIETDPAAGITSSVLMYGYTTSTSTQGFEITKILNSDYYEIDVLTNGSVAGTTLASGISETGTIQLSNATSFVQNDLVKIGEEYIQLGDKSGSTFGGSTANVRGRAGSQVSSHASGSTVSEVKTTSTGSTSFTLAGGNCYLLYDAHAATTGYVAGSGWGAGRWAGRPDTVISTDLTSDMTTSTEENISVTSSVGFSGSSAENGTLLIEKELMKYEGTGSGTIDIVAVSSGGRGAFGTTAAAHTAPKTVFNVTSEWTGWGSANTGETASDSLRVWSLDNYGEDLIMAPKDGRPYYWNKSQRTELSTPTTISGTAKGNNGMLNGSAVPMSSMGLSSSIVAEGYDIGQGEVPEQVRVLMVHPTQPIIVAFGATDTFGSFDPLLVRWSDQDRPGSWAVEAGNLAGGTPLQTGSEIIGAARSKREILIWTDEAAYGMRYTGGDQVFSFDEVASGVSIVSTDGYGVAGDRIYWMADRNFYMYDGSVTLLPCSVVNYVFEDETYGLNFSKREKVFAARNTSFGEITWFYPSGESESVDRYVTYNYIENSWAVGSMSRTAWSDSGIRQYPHATAPIDETETSSRLYLHEKGSDDDGNAMTAYIESGFIDIDDGDHFSFVSRIIPDIRYARGGETGMSIDITPKDYPSTGASSGTTIQTSVTSSSTESQIRLRGRQLALKFTSTGQGVGWTLGDTRVSIQPDGRR